jgi:hypothetical protein
MYFVLDVLGVRQDHHVRDRRSEDVEVVIEEPLKNENRVFCMSGICNTYIPTAANLSRNSQKSIVYFPMIFGDYVLLCIDNKS